MAAKAVEWLVARVIRLYEQDPGEAFALSRPGKYVYRWIRWLYNSTTPRTEEVNAVP